MKKSILIGLLVIVGFAANAQMCDTVRLFPWNNNFYTHFDCWEQLGDSTPLWHANSDNNYNFQNAAYIVAPNDTAANGCVLVSPALALPADTANMLLSFRTRRVGATVRLRVLVSTGPRENLAGYDTLLSVTPSGINNYEVNLSAYTGQTVYVAFSFVKANQTNDVTFFGVGSVNIISDRMPQGEWFMQNIAARTGDTVEHEFYLTHGIENDSNTLFTWHSTMVDAGQATLVEVVTDMYQDYTTGTGRTLPRSIYRLIYHSQGTDTMTLTVSNIYGTITTQSVSRIYVCQPIVTFPTVLEYNLFALCGGGDNLYPYQTGATSHSFIDEDGGTYTTNDSYLRSNINYGDRGYLVTPRIVVPADGVPISLMLHYRHGPLEVRATTADVTDTSLFSDLLFTEPGSTTLRTRKVSLAAYAGDTVRLAIIHKGGTLLEIMPDMNVDYDTLPKIASVQVPSLATVDSAALCTASLRYGPTEGLHFIWHSARGGVFVTNALGDSAWVTYPGGVGDKDTIRVVASNNYGSDTVVRTVNILDCTPQLVLPWKETFANGTACWYKFEGCKFYDAIPYNYSAYEHKRHLYLNTKTDTLGSWIMSKAIAIPADTTLGVRLFWKVASSVNAYQHLYSMLATTSADYTDTANYTVLYTDNSTHINFSNYDTRSVSLDQYAGQTIHIAIHNHGNHLAPSSIGLYLDDIEVRTTTVPVVTLASNASTYYWGDIATFTATLSEGSPSGLTYTWHSTLLDTTINYQLSTFNLSYTIPGTDTVTVIATNAYGSDTAMVIVNSVIITQPEVTLQHTDANVGTPTVYTALLNHCVTTGLTYTWHSTLLDSTVNSQLSTFNLTYTQSGVDTVTVIASTIYGADTAMVVVNVQSCAPRALPYYENFNGIVATAATTAGNLPDCWNYYWNGDNSAYAPHVIGTGDYQYMSDIPNNALFFVAGGSTGYGSSAVVFLPHFADSLQRLALALDYRFESNNRGILSVGWFDNNEVFHTVKNLASHTDNYVRDTILFTDQIAANYRIALWWEYGSTWYAAVVDNIVVLESDSIDDSSTEVPLSCATLASAEAASLGPTSAMISWQYDTLGTLPADGVLVDLYDTTANTSIQFVVHGTDTILTGLPLRHAFRADLRTLCGTDTSEAVSVTFAPEAAVCAEIAGDYDYSAYMFCTPISGDKNYGYSQTLYPAELAASVDTLYGIALRIGATGESRTLDIYIGQTSADTLISPVSVATHTLAAQNYHFQPVSTWTKILFDTPVPIDGVNNLIVTIDDNTGDWLNPMPSNAHYDSPGVMLYYDEHFYSTVNVDPVALGFNVSRTNKIPDLQLLGHCATERCLQPVITVEPDSNMLAVSWQQRGSESLWCVEYRREGSINWLLAGTTSETSYDIYGLNASTPYEVRVGSVCAGDVIYSNSVRCYTPCGVVSLPYHHDFTIDNTCWYTHNNYSSSSVGLDLNAGSWPVASPAVSGDISQTAVRFRISGNPNWNPLLRIGVGGSNGENAVWIDSMTLSHSDVQEYTVYLTGYTGNEHHVLFQADDPYARMREVTFETVECQAVHHVVVSQLTDTSALLSWPPVNDEGGEWAVYVDDSLVAVTTTPSYLLVGLESGTEHTAAVREICNVGDTADATTVTFTTLCPVHTLPWIEDFESYSTSPAYTTDAVVPCWHTILPTINVSSYVSLVSIGVHNNSHALRFHDHIYVTQHGSDDFIYAASSLVNTAGQTAIVQFDLHVERVAQSPDQPFTFQAGIMTDITDTTTFIPLTIITTPGDTLCSFSIDDSSQFSFFNSQFSIAFRFRGDIIAYVDNLSVTAASLPMYDLTLAVNDTTMGTVIGGGIYEEGTVVTVTAVPNEGYHFVIWSDSVTEVTRQITLRNKNITLTAYFAVDTVWRTVNVVRNLEGMIDEFPEGYVSGTGVYADGDTVTLSLPDYEYGYKCPPYFYGWVMAPGDTIFGLECTFVVTSDTTITAYYRYGVGIDNVSTYQHINVYPNPATETVTVYVDQPATLTIMDATGRLCGQWKVERGETTLDISHLPAGVYFVRLANNTIVIKLIIQ